MNHKLRQDGFHDCPACTEIATTGDPDTDLHHRHDRRRLTPLAVAVMGSLALLALASAYALTSTLITLPDDWPLPAAIAAVFGVIAVCATFAAYQDWRKGEL